MLSISSYARRRGVASSTVRRWLAELVGDLQLGEIRELDRGTLPEVSAVERTVGGHYRLKIVAQVA